MPTQPIIKFLTSSGAGSRRAISAIIKRGGVAVNGSVIESFNHPVDASKDVITIDGKRLSRTAAETHVYLMLNKPKGVVSTAKGEHGERTVMDLVPEKHRHLRLYPVGRLDKDTTGLLLLTNDGDATFRLTHPRFEQEKEYMVRIEGKLRPEDKEQLEKGVRLEEGLTAPARVRETRTPSIYYVTIHEGKKRQVRRMFGSLGYVVLELQRTRFGGLRLGRLGEGEVRELTKEEVEGITGALTRETDSTYTEGKTVEKSREVTARPRPRRG